MRYPISSRGNFCRVIITMGKNDIKGKYQIQIPYSPSNITNYFKPIIPQAEYQPNGEYLLATLEKDAFNLSIPQMLAQLYPSNTHFIFKATGLTQQFYETILTHTNSIEINHTVKEGEVINSELKILHILLPSE